MENQQKILTSLELIETEKQEMDNRQKNPMDEKVDEILSDNLKKLLEIMATEYYPKRNEEINKINNWLKTTVYSKDKTRTENYTVEEITQKLGEIEAYKVIQKVERSETIRKMTQN